MDLIQAVKICVEADVSVQVYFAHKSTAYMDSKAFLKMFDEFEVKPYEDVKSFLVVEKEIDGIIFKAIVSESELKERENA